MSASLTDKLMKVAANGAATTLTAPGKSVGDSSIAVGATTGFPQDTAFIIAIRTVDTNGNEVEGTYTEFIAYVASSTGLTINPVPVYGNDQVYSGGSLCQVYVPVSSYAYNLLINTMMGIINQDGTLKSAAINNALTTYTGRVVPRISSVASTSTLAPNIDNYNYYRLRAQAGALTISNPTGTPNDGDGLLIEIQDNGSSQSVSWGTNYIADSVYGLPLITATTAGKTHFITFIYNSSLTKYVAVL
jgi:hypothetical protein